MISTATKAAANVTKVLAENDARNTLKDTARDLQDRGSDLVNNVADYAGEAGARVRGIVDRTVEDVNHVSQNVEGEIRGNPVRSTLIALGIGFALGALLTRR
jgi:ElaB/YqjD/DUF883 family membrane-anchored ribosome-binding protein